MPAIIYIVKPLDAIPDFLPGGFVDDGMIIISVYITIEFYITEEHRKKAGKILKQMFGN